MIKIDRGKEPDFLKSEVVDLATEKMEEFYLSKNRSQKRYNFPFENEIDKELKKHLHEAFHGKCGYCEIKISSPEVGTVDRFRPHNGVRDKKEYYQDLYWWLVFNWDNLIYCCKDCNQYKANYFPISGKRAMSSTDNLEQEKRLLVNPCSDDPDKHFIYDHKGNIHSDTKEGNQTIELLRLDRTNLLEKRLSARREIIDIIEELIEHGNSSKPKVDYLQSIYDENDYSIEFLSYKNWVLLNEIESTPYLTKLLNIDDDQEEFKLTKSHVGSKSKKEISKKNIIINDYFPIEYIHIKNFKSISDLRIDFKDDEVAQKSWLFLLGENGVGKSSILQAIAIGLSADRNLLGPLITKLIKKGKQKSEITIKEKNSNNFVKTILFKKDKVLIQEGTFNSFLLGYGSLRLSKEESDKEEKDLEKISYVNLFKPIIPLNDITKWLKNTHKNDIELFNRIAYSIKQLLPEESKNNELTIENGEIMFKDSDKLFSELSDGFKSTIILAVDIMMKLSSAKADMDKMSGLVLIDELGNQLHPRWQMRIVKQLRTVFPNINFIISTHHPLCLRGAEKDEILLLKSFENEVFPITELPDPSSLRVDQILASEFFGLSSLIDPELEAKFNRYFELLSKERINDSTEENELNELKDELRNKKQLGSSLREELMYTVIDKLLAQKVVYNKSSLTREELKIEAVNRVREIWSKLNINSDD